MMHKTVYEISKVTRIQPK